MDDVMDVDILSCDVTLLCEVVLACDESLGRDVTPPTPESSDTELMLL